uniref:Uncharacterized protein n=1 Tax=viral metagenome TaxID=1070528 RepID=A0A6M3JFJ6_9ZZZZ
MKPIKIRWSEFPRETPIEVFIIQPYMGKIKAYGYQKYVEFNAYIILNKVERKFELVLPMEKVERAFQSLPVTVKNSELVRLVFQKQDMGKLNIISIEEVT